MKVLLLTNRVPFPPDSGYPIVVYNTIKGLLAQGAEVSVFSLNPQSHFTELKTCNDPILDKITFQTASVNNVFSTFESILNLFSRRSAQITRFYKSAPVAKLRNFLLHNQFDIVQLEGLFVMPYLNVIRQNSRARIVYRAHNIEHQISAASIQTNSFFRNIYQRILYHRLYRFELENLNKPDAVITISESDKSHLVSMGCKVCTDNFPVAVDPEDYKPDLSKVERSSIFHLGSMDSIPTAEGIEWFIHNVWNDLKALNSGLKFYLAGRDIPDEFYNNEDLDFIITDDLADAKDFINSKSVMIVPLRSGSGMRVKIIEGMAMKKCIISTSFGAEGIHYQHGHNILIADTPDEFYRYILQCATDHKFCEEIGENARKLVEREYDLSSNALRLLDFYNSNK